MDCHAQGGRTSMIAEHAMACTQTAGAPLPFLRSATKAFLDGIVRGGHLLAYIRGLDGISVDEDS